MLKKFLKNDKGLTLVELLAVIVILGIIAAIAVPSIANIIENSRADAVKAEGLQVLNAAKLYVASEGVPADGSDLDATDLADYLTENDEDIWTEAYSVTITDANTFTITGTGTKGSVSIEFINASINEINDAAKDDREIGTAPDSEI